jgi:hypothetical protein
VPGGRRVSAGEHSIQLTSTNIGPGGSTYLVAAGFLPQHPVKLDIDNQEVASMTANTLGSVSYVVDPALLKLSRGRHILTVKSMLLTATANFATG